MPLNSMDVLIARADEALGSEHGQNTRLRDTSAGQPDSYR